MISNLHECLHCEKQMILRERKDVNDGFGMSLSCQRWKQVSNLVKKYSIRCHSKFEKSKLSLIFNFSIFVCKKYDWIVDELYI